MHECTVACSGNRFVFLHEFGFCSKFRREFIFFWCFVFFRFVNFRYQYGVVFIFFRPSVFFQVFHCDCLCGCKFYGRFCCLRVWVCPCELSVEPFGNGCVVFRFEEFECGFFRIFFRVLLFVCLCVFSFEFGRKTVYCRYAFQCVV